MTKFNENWKLAEEQETIAKKLFDEIAKQPVPGYRYEMNYEELKVMLYVLLSGDPDAKYDSFGLAYELGHARGYRHGMNDAKRKAKKVQK